MNTTELIPLLDAEIERLQRARSLLTDGVVHVPKNHGNRRRRKLSAEARARISAAQKARWAKQKKGSH